jgi:hypothetical protein
MLYGDLTKPILLFMALMPILVGAAGSDPVGPAVVQIRKFSPSLKAFIETMAAFGSYEALQAAVAGSSCCAVSL